MEVYLHYGDDKQAAVVVKPIENGIKITDGDKINFRLTGGLAEVLHSWARRVEPGGVLRGTPPQEEKFNLITADDLTGEDEHDWRLIVRRFPDLADAIPKEYQQGEQAVDQLGIDLEMVRSIVEELFDDNGELVWGGQSRIAKELGIRNGGETNRQRIFAVVEELRRQSENPNSLP